MRKQNHITQRFTDYFNPINVAYNLVTMCVSIILLWEGAKNI